MHTHIHTFVYPGLLAGRRRGETNGRFPIRTPARAKHYGVLGRGDATIGIPHRAQSYQFELFELKFLNSSFSSANCSIRAFRVCPLIYIRQAAPCRAVRGNGISVNSSLPPPLLRTLRRARRGRCHLVGVQRFGAIILSYPI